MGIQPGGEVAVEDAGQSQAGLLTGGRGIRGARGVLVAADPSLAAALDVLDAHGLRVADPRAVAVPVLADLLVRLGARAVLEDPAAAAAALADEAAG